MTSAPPRLTDYCGFLSLDDARAARDKIAAQAIAWEIAIREGEGGAEEYWLRVDVNGTRQVAQLLGDVPVAEQPEDGGFACGECGAHVGENDEVCPGCGARFD